MKILLDLNVLLDVIQKREPFYESSASVLSLITQDKIIGYIPGHALTTIYYIVTRNLKDFTGSPISALTPEEFMVFYEH